MDAILMTHSNSSLVTRRRFLISTALAAAGLVTQKSLGYGQSYGRDPYLSGELGYTCYRTPAIVISTSGTILAFCGARSENCKDDGDHDIVLRRSIDGGRSWGPLFVVANDGKNRCDIPIPVILPNDRILLLWVWNEYVTRKEDRGKRLVMVCHSDDDGLSWSPPRDITSQVRLPHWKPWYGLGPGHGFVKQLNPGAGRIVIPARHGEIGLGSRSHLIISDDGGLTWTIGAQALGPEISSEATACELGDGGIMMNSRGDVGYRITTLSPDGGLNASETYVDHNLIEPANGCQASLLTYKLNRAQGSSLLLFSNPAHPQVRTNGRLRLSRDNGGTWNSGYNYQRSQNAFTGYSDIARFSNGDVGILFESGASFKKGQFADALENSQISALRTSEGKSLPSHPNRKLRIEGRTDNRHDRIAFERIPFAWIE